MKRLMVSDGEVFCQAMLNTKINHLVDQDILERNCIFTLTQFATNIVQGKRSVLMLLRSSIPV